jgi:uncharacterized membrane protein YgaE (UPF0421/DUF939 family)
MYTNVVQCSTRNCNVPKANANSKAVSAAVGAVIGFLYFLYIGVPIIILCVIGCIVYFCCCKNKQPQTIVMTQAAPATGVPVAQPVQ